MQTLSNLFYPFETNNFVTLPFAEEVHNNYKYIRGQLVLAGRQPDGDSVGFIPDNPALFRDVYRGYLLHASSRDGSVQLRLEGIDTPELHYGSAFQPLAVAARDYLVHNLLGFDDIIYSDENSNTHPAYSVSDSVPTLMRAKIATNALEIHGRPISYVFLDEELEDGTTAPLNPSLLEKSMNYKMLVAGYAYLLAYTSMPAAHYQVFKKVANKARLQKLGVWKGDTTNDFVLADPGSIAGNAAQLIYPKLFRRCIDFLKSGQTDLKDWLRSNEPENDGVRITEFTTVSLSSLIRQVNDHTCFEVDTNDIMFIEK